MADDQAAAPDEHRDTHPEENVPVRADHEGALGSGAGWKTPVASSN